ncbi:hypothetical protein ACYCE1_000723 [Enterobacter hormaechei]
MVSIANHMQNTDAKPKSIKPIVNWHTAERIESQTEMFIKEDNVSSGLKRSHSSISEPAGRFLLVKYISLYLSVENSLSFKLTITKVCKDKSNEPTDMKPENK